MLPLINCVIDSFLEEPWMSWSEANDHCKGEGGKLVEIDSKEENKILVEEIDRKDSRTGT